ncbi:hypothetical protein WG904_09135 [Pedobacter sp. Du54]
MERAKLFLPLQPATEVTGQGIWMIVAGVDLGYGERVLARRIILK